MGPCWRVVAEADDVTAAAVAQGVVDLADSEPAELGGVGGGHAGNIGRLEAGQGDIGSVAQWTPLLDPDHAFGSLGRAIGQVGAEALGLGDISGTTFVFVFCKMELKIEREREREKERERKRDGGGPCK